MSNINVTIRMNEDLKGQADELFSKLGMNLSTAMNVFARQAVRTQSIPFKIDASVAGVDPQEMSTAKDFIDEYEGIFQRLADET